jgi:hypothetical protein
LNHINISVELKEGQNQYTLSDNDIKPSDYLVLIRRDVNGYDHYMLPDEYNIVNVDRSSNTYALLTIKDINNYKTGDMIYITGIRLGYGR